MITFLEIGFVIRYFINKSRDCVLDNNCENYLNIFASVSPVVVASTLDIVCF